MMALGERPAWRSSLRHGSNRVAAHGTDEPITAGMTPDNCDAQDDPLICLEMRPVDV
jgi:hypothetical protein